MIYLLGAVVAGLVLHAFLLQLRLGGLEERLARLEGPRDPEPGPYRAAPPVLQEPAIQAPASRETVQAEVEEALQRGNVIEAIKRYRQLTGAGLKESKEAVEAIRHRRG